MDEPVYVEKQNMDPVYVQRQDPDPVQAKDLDPVQVERHNQDPDHVLGLSLAGNLVKPLLSLCGTEWRERGFELWKYWRGGTETFPVGLLYFSLACRHIDSMWSRGPGPCLDLQF